ncbi:MAG: glycosyltransferase family 4 protein, partial [Anaerolineae bacterium]|nr:glycosyltransferase family 4 protein [Anaerolineae bacterium]
MRILYLHQYFTLPTESGGTRSYEFARRWQAHGHEVTIITSNSNLPSEYQKIRRPVRTVLAGLPVAIIPTHYTQKMSYPQRMGAFLLFALAASREALRQRADVIYASSTPLTIAIPGILARTLRRIPLVMEIRDL